VRSVAPYRWEGPADDHATRELIAACLKGQVDALLILSSSQIQTLFSVAETHGQDEVLRRALNNPRLLVAAIGPVAAQATLAQGVRVDFVPEHPRMGHLTTALGPLLAARGGRGGPDDR
jgi:uroporphyrinogen-III synthase